MTKPTTEKRRQPTTDDAQRSRREAAALLRGDVALSDELRLDTIMALRASIDNANDRAMRGERIDLVQVLQAEERLRAILPPARPLPDNKLAEHQRRQAAIAPVIAFVRRLHEQIAALTCENVTLRLAVRTALAPAPGAAPVEAAPAAPADNVVPMKPPAPATPAPAAPAAPAYDYDRERGWRDHVLPDSSISPTPMSGGKWWGPV
jgi:hypothetical protein